MFAFALMKKKFAFIDRDGTIAVEPKETHQINSLAELSFLPDVISALRFIQSKGYEIVVVSNQDKLGTSANPLENYETINEKIKQVLGTEHIHIQSWLTCPHTLAENCTCRKPKTGLVDYLKSQIDKDKSFMVGDRITDVEFAENLGIKGFQLTADKGWKAVCDEVTQLNSRKSIIRRTTTETDIELHLFLDGSGKHRIQTGLHFFDHMLEQFSKHGMIDLYIIAHKNDLAIDEHHLIEDVAICLGMAVKECLQDKIGIERYDYEWLLPMDETAAHVAIDISGRPHAAFSGTCSREYVGDFPTEMLPHFYETFAMNAGITLHVKMGMGNNHHQIESSFKALAKCLHKATRIVHNQVSSTKGML